jgi:glycerophosphoryl diester phosphodiesterase
VILIAHRGDPRHAPENTIQSFRKAAARGARAVEMDLRRRADGRWVVFHNPLPKTMVGPVLELSEALSFCRRRRLKAYLDVKDPRDERSLARLIRSSRWLSRTTLLADGPATLRRWRRIFPRQPLFWVTGFWEPVTPQKIAWARHLHLTGFVSYRRWVTRVSVERVHRAGLKICVWTVRTVADLRRFSRLGVDGIMSEVWPPPRSI